MLSCDGGVVGCPRSDQNGLVSLSGKGLVVRLLSRVTEIHIALAMVSIQLKKVAGPIRHDPHFVAQPPY